MTLRIMLVGLVASLGFELPSEADVTCWAEAGKAWVMARIDDPSGPTVEPRLDPEGLTDCHQAEESFEVSPLVGEINADADMAFVAASEKVVEELASDLLAGEPEPIPTEEVAYNPVLEQPATVGLPEGEELGCLIVPAVEAEPTDIPAIEAEPATDEVEPADESPTRLDQVSDAIRLTRDAVLAWSNLMQQPVDDGQATR